MNSKQHEIDASTDNLYAHKSRRDYTEAADADCDYIQYHSVETLARVFTFFKARPVSVQEEILPKPSRAFVVAANVTMRIAICEE